MYDDQAQVDLIEEKKVNAKKLTELPIEQLPCPKELMQSMEETYGHPVQNEIRLKAFSKASILKAFGILIYFKMLCHIIL